MCCTNMIYPGPTNRNLEGRSTRLKPSYQGSQGVQAYSRALGQRLKNLDKKLNLDDLHARMLACYNVLCSNH